MDIIHIKESKVHEDDELLKDLFKLDELMNEILDQIEERGHIYDHLLSEGNTGCCNATYSKHTR